MQEKDLAPVTCILVGAGTRARIYASYSQKHPDQLKIVGVVDPNPEHRQIVQDLYHFPDENCFSDVHELAQKPKLADAIINGTMDEDHVATTLPLLPLGYDVLLEKPAALTPASLMKLFKTTQRYGNNLMICHVLRYANFYRKVKELILDGVIGDLLHLSLEEHVSAIHLAISYARGKWGNRKKCGSGMLLAKSSHDVDLVMWLSALTPKTIQSVASNKLFDPARKPEGAGKRCLVDCQIEEDCLYSARKHYLGHTDRWPQYVWDFKQDEMTPQEQEDFIRYKSPYGRCVWDCDYDNVSQQSVLFQFEDGTTATFNMLGGCAESGRFIHIMGTRGEIKGRFEDGVLELRLIDPEEPEGFRYEKIEIEESEGGHGGGDFQLVEDFISIVQGKEPSISATTIKSSVEGHLAVFAAEEAAKMNEVVDFNEFYENFED